MTYEEPDAQAFVAAMKAADFKVKHYEGRFDFKGPSVTVSDHSELVRAIQAAPKHLFNVLRWDTMGREGFVVYGPRGRERSGEP